MNTNSEEYTKWVMSLKEGDEVALQWRAAGDPYYSIHQINKITKTQLVFNRGSLVQKVRRKDGRLVGEYRWGAPRIESVSDKVKESVIRRLAIEKLMKVDWKKIPMETLTKIVDLLPSQGKPS